MPSCIDLSIISYFLWSAVSASCPCSASPPSPVEPAIPNMKLEMREDERCSQIGEIIWKRSRTRKKLGVGQGEAAVPHIKGCFGVSSDQGSISGSTYLILNLASTVLGLYVKGPTLHRYNVANGMSLNQHQWVQQPCFNLSNIKTHCSLKKYKDSLNLNLKGNPFLLWSKM